MNMLHLSDAERERLIDAEWEGYAGTEGGGQYLAELKMYATRQTRTSLMDISKVFTEAKDRCEVYECSHKQKGNSNDRYGIYCKRKRGD